MSTLSSTSVKTTDGVAVTVTPAADGSYAFSTGKVLTRDESVAFVSYLADNDQVIPVPVGLVPLFLIVKIFLAAAVKGDRAGVVNAFGRAFTWLCDFLGLPNSPKISKKGSPKKAGCVAAIKGTIVGLTQFKAETGNTNVSADDLTKDADYLSTGWALQTMLKAGIEKIDRNTIPVARDAVTSMRHVLDVVDPILETHSDLAVALNDTLSYLKDPHKKAAQSRKANKRKTKKAVATATANALPQARNEVRTEVKQQLSDTLSGFLSTNKS